MKFKTLKRVSPVDSKYDEYASIDAEGEMYTHEHPKWLGNEATIEGLKKLCNVEDIDIDWENYKIVEIEYFEVNTVGADIRNKLTPSLNLISLLRIYFTESDNALDDTLHREKILPFIKKEMLKSEENIKYISNLL
jgi:hypothetical protein